MITPAEMISIRASTVSFKNKTVLARMLIISAGVISIRASTVLFLNERG